MKFIYPAVFRKTENGTYHGFFPDLECCYADGDTLDDAIDNANEAAYNWISLELSEDDCNLPSVSDKEDIVRNISVISGFTKAGTNNRPSLFVYIPHI